MGDVKMINNITIFPVVRYAFLTLTEPVTISQISKYVTDHVQGDAPFAERVYAALSAFATEHGLGLLMSDNGSDFVLYEVPFFSMAEAVHYLQSIKVAA